MNFGFKAILTTGQAPLYAQIRGHLLQRIALGLWKPGDLLPSETALADEFAVSQGTVRKALDGLVANNLVVRHQGKGTFVATHTPQRELFHFFHLVDQNFTRQMPETSRLISCQLRRGERHELHNLKLGSNAHVVVIRRVRRLYGKPVIMERIVVPSKLFPGLSENDNVPNELYHFFEKTYGVTIHKAIENIYATSANQETSLYLGLKQGAPVLGITRIAESLDGAPVEYRLSLCNTCAHTYMNEIV